MISNLLKEHKEEIYKMVMKNNTTKILLKQIDTIFKRIEMMLERDLKKLLVRKRKKVGLAGKEKSNVYLL